MARKAIKSATDMAKETDAKIAALDTPKADQDPAPEDAAKETGKDRDKPPVKDKVKPVPDPTPKVDDGKADAAIKEMQGQIQTLNTNYGELRSHSTRVEQENALLKSEIELYRLKPEVKPTETPEIAATPEPNDADNGGRPAIDALSELDAEYSELTVPIRKVIDSTIQPLQRQLEQITGQIGSLTNNITLTREDQARIDQDNAARVHFNAINSAHSDCAAILSSASFKEWLKSLPGGNRTYALMYPLTDQDDGWDTKAVIDFITKFKEVSPEYRAALDEEAESAQRLADAEADSEGDAILAGIAATDPSDADKVRTVKMSEVRAARKQNDINLTAKLLGEAHLAATYGKLIQD